MQFEEELLFRRIANEDGLVTIEHVEECLLLQHNNPHATSLFVTMIEKGYINHKNMAAILKKIPPQAGEDAPLFTNRSQKFGELCVEKGFTSTAQVAESLAIQERLKTEGRHFRLGQILMEKKYLTVHQAQIILEQQGKKILRCPSCETKFNIRHYQPHKKYQCPKCNGELAAFEGSSNPMGVERSVMARETVEVDDESLSLIGKKVGEYQIQELVGEGGMASVYRAVNQGTGKARALKIMKSQGGVERFTREFESASALRHPNIIRVYERGTFDNRPYFFMEYIDGGTLARRIEKMGVIPVNEGINILRQVAMGLKYAHENNIVHRDIKPSNIMMTVDSNKKLIAKITDFGIARAASDSHITMTGQLVGTFKYMSPEYIKGHSVDGKNDIFSLGIVSYEMFAGREPFNVDAPVGYLFVNIKETPPALHQLNPDLPKELSWVVSQMLAKDAHKRYDATALLRDLDRLWRHVNEGATLAESEDKTSVFYNRSTFLAIKGLWDKLFGTGESPEIPPQPENKAADELADEADNTQQFFQTQEVGKDATCQKEFEFALELIKKGNVEAAKKNLQAVMDVFPGTAWAAKAKKKLTNLSALETQQRPKDLREDRPEEVAKEKEDGSIKKKASLKKVDDLGAATKILPASPLESLARKEAPGKMARGSETISRLQAPPLPSPKSSYPIPEYQPIAAEDEPVAKSGHEHELEPPLFQESPSKSMGGSSTVSKAQDLLVSVKAFLDKVKTIEEYEQKQAWLDEVFSYVHQVKWEFAQEEVSEILHKWGRFLLDHGKYGEGMTRFWELYEKFPDTRWYRQVLEELVSMEQPKDMTFIEGGTFNIGDSDNETIVDIKPFFVDINLVTNAQYLEFVKDAGYPSPIHWIGDMYPVGKGNHPVVWVSAEDAFVYASWCNKSVPTEEEWEVAARGPQRLRFPWGNAYENGRCNCRESGVGDTTAVGTYPSGKSYYHCLDMAGNVWQWTDSWYDTQSKNYRVLRGGSWFTLESFTTCSYRNFDFPSIRSGLYGFRCIKPFHKPAKI